MTKSEHHPFPPREDVKWLPYKDSLHKERLLALLASTETDALHQLFASLYLLAATGIEPTTVLMDKEIDFDACQKASVTLDTEAQALADLALGLLRPEAPIDIRKDLEALSGTPSFELAIQAIRLRWED